jgi:hypothetical protein
MNRVVREAGERLGFGVDRDFDFAHAVSAGLANHLLEDLGGTGRVVYGAGRHGTSIFTQRSREKSNYSRR